MSKKNKTVIYKKTGAYGFWKAVESVCLAAISKGQAPLVMLLFLFIVMAARLPNNSLGIVTEQLVSLLVNIWYIGWALSVVLAASWWYHAKAMRKIHFKEIERISDEKTKLQEDFAGQSANPPLIKSSNK